MESALCPLRSVVPYGTRGRVLDTIRRHALVRRGDRVLVALSGGPDSVALLRLLRELEAAGELVVAGVAHLNHGLRDAAPADEQFCRALAAESGIPFRSDLVDVRARAERLRHLPRGRGPAGALRAVRAGRDRARAEAIATATRATIRPRRFCCASCAAPVRGASPAFIRERACPPKRRRREGGSCGRCSTSAATSSERIWPRSVSRSETTRAIAT